MRPDLLLALVALQADVDPTLLQALAWVESGHRTNIIVQNDGGSPSHGLTQMKLGTARMLDKRMSAASLMNPWVNARTAAWYLKRQIARYGAVECALIAYNRGSFKQCSKFDIYDSSRYPEYVKRIKRAMKERPWTRKESTHASTHRPDSHRARQPAQNRGHH